MQINSKVPQTERTRGFSLFMGEGRAEKIIPSILNEFGCSLKRVEDPSEQLLLLRTSPPDILVVGTVGDMGSRLEMCEQLASLRTHRYFPILLIVDWNEVQSGHLAGNSKFVHCVDDIIIAPFSTEELRFRLGSMLALRANIGELEKLEVEYQDYRSKDEVSGLCSEDNLLERINRELARAQKYHATFSCLRVGTTFDIGARTDHGETVLISRGLAELAGAHIRSADFAGRMDDNSLLVVASGTDQFGATVLAEKLAEAIVEQSSQWTSLVNKFRFGISIVTFAGETSCETEELLDATKHAMDKVLNMWGERIYSTQFGGDGSADRPKNV